MHWRRPRWIRHRAIRNASAPSSSRWSDQLITRGDVACTPTIRISRPTTLIGPDRHHRLPIARAWTASAGHHTEQRQVGPRHRATAITGPINRHQHPISRPGHIQADHLRTRFSSVVLRGRSRRPHVPPSPVRRRPMRPNPTRPVVHTPRGLKASPTREPSKHDRSVHRHHRPGINRTRTECIDVPADAWPRSTQHRCTTGPAGTGDRACLYRAACGDGQRSGKIELSWGYALTISAH